jgi:hypothetical protein
LVLIDMSHPVDAAVGAQRGGGRSGKLVVPALFLCSAAMVGAHIVFSGDTYQDCEYLGPSTRMYVTAWAAPALGLAALLLLVVWARVLRGGGRRLSEDWQGVLVLVAGCLSPLLLLFECAVLYWTYAPDPAGGVGCEGLALLLGG